MHQNVDMFKKYALNVSNNLTNLDEFFIVDLITTQLHKMYSLIGKFSQYGTFHIQIFCETCGVLESLKHSHTHIYIHLL